MQLVQGLLNWFPDNLDFFMLLFLRTTALLISSPIFGRRNIPNYAKIGFCLMFALVLYHGEAAPYITYNFASEYWLLCVKEILLGLALGFATTAFFSLMFWAGYSIDMQMGFGMVNIFDVQNNINVPVSGNLLNILMFIMFFMTDGHLKLLTVIANSVAQVPLGQFILNPNFALIMLELMATTFIIGLNIAMPMIAVGLILEAALGIIIRSVPQMNMFVVGIPLKIVLGLLILMMMVPAFVNITNSIFDTMFYYIDRIFTGMVA